MKRAKAAIRGGSALGPRQPRRCHIRISAIMLSVRQSTRRFLTTFSVFTSMSPKHETDDDAKRECGGERGDRTIRYKFLDVIFLLAQGLAKLIQRCLDLIGERFGAVLRGVEDSLAGGIEQARHVVLERLQLISQFA